MTQKEKTIFVIKSIIISEIEDSEIKDHLIPKIESCLELANPEVLLSMDQAKLFEKLKEDAKRKGKII